MREMFLSLVAATLLACSSAHSMPPSDGRPEVAVRVEADGYHPAEVTAAAGQPVRLVVTRTSDEGCGQQIVFPDLGIRRDLPLGTPVAIDLTMPATGRVAFTCGMSMYQGAIVAR